MMFYLITVLLGTLYPIFTDAGSIAKSQLVTFLQFCNNTHCNCFNCGNWT